MPFFFVLVKSNVIHYTCVLSLFLLQMKADIIHKFMKDLGKEIEMHNESERKWLESQRSVMVYIILINMIETIIDS